MKQIKGDIFEGEWDGLVHCCNLYHTFGAGIAKAIKEKYPKAYAADLKTSHGDVGRLGTFSEGFYYETDYFSIFNLYGQLGVGNSGDPRHKNVQYDAIYNGLFEICDVIVARLKNLDRKYVLAMPLIGCGLAGGSESIMIPLLEYVESHFSDRIEFVLYKL